MHRAPNMVRHVAAPGQRDGGVRGRDVHPGPVLYRGAAVVVRGQQHHLSGRQVPAGHRSMHVPRRKLHRGRVLLRPDMRVARHCMPRGLHGMVIAGLSAAQNKQCID
jgi:hypothetical protein